MGPDSGFMLGSPTSASQHFGTQPGARCALHSTLASSNPRLHTTMGDRDQKGLLDPTICKWFVQSWTRSEGLRVLLQSDTLLCRLEAFELFCRAALMAVFLRNYSCLKTGERLVQHPKRTTALVFKPPSLLTFGVQSAFQD